MHKGNVVIYDIPKINYKRKMYFINSLLLHTHTHTHTLQYIGNQGHLPCMYINVYRILLTRNLHRYSAGVITSIHPLFGISSTRKGPSLTPTQSIQFTLYNIPQTHNHTQAGDLPVAMAIWQAKDHSLTPT